MIRSGHREITHKIDTQSGNSRIKFKWTVIGIARDEVETISIFIGDIVIPPAIKQCKRITVISKFVELCPFRIWIVNLLCSVQ